MRTNLLSASALLACLCCPGAFASAGGGANAVNCRSILDPNECLSHSPVCEWDDTEPSGQQCETSHQYDLCSQFDGDANACTQTAACKWDQQESHCETAGLP